MSGLAKLLLAAAGAVVALALLAILYAGASARGKRAHCRNNLRYLGQLAVQNWEALDPQRGGRDFWQQVRELRYRDVRGKWSAPAVDPFVCPVHGRTLSNLQDPRAIDYRGPRVVRGSARETPKDEPIGADRPGNHAAGGFVLRLDGSAQPVDLLLEEAGAGGPAWQAADRHLRD